MGHCTGCPCDSWLAECSLLTSPTPDRHLSHRRGRDASRQRDMRKLDVHPPARLAISRRPDGQTGAWWECPPTAGPHEQPAPAGQTLPHIYCSAKGAPRTGQPRSCWDTRVSVRAFKNARRIRARARFAPRLTPPTRPLSLRSSALSAGVGRGAGRQGRPGSLELEFVGRGPPRRPADAGCRSQELFAPHAFCPPGPSARTATGPSATA